MATNRKYAPTNNLTIPATAITGPNSPVQSGDPVLVGVGNVPAVALNDEDADANVVVQFGTATVVYNLPVVGEDNAGNAAVAAGDLVYYEAGAINADDVAGTAYGTALAAVNSGATTTIAVAVGLGV